MGYAREHLCGVNLSHGSLLQVGRGPFHKACESGNVAIVKCLVDVYDHYSGSGDRVWGLVQREA